MDVGESKEYIAGAVGMWLDIPATTDLVEEAHGGGASLKRDHKTYGERTLRARSVIHEARTLIHASPFERKMAKLAESMKQLEGKTSQCCAFRTLYRHSSGSVSRDMMPHRAQTYANQQLVLRHAREIFNALPVMTKRYWAIQARKRKHFETEQRQEDTNALRARILLEEERHEIWETLLGSQFWLASAG